MNHSTQDPDLRVLQELGGLGLHPPLILIVGPTAVGKTEIAIQLAERLNGEIVSADSRLFYRGMDIGTAKPTLAERARVSHHLIDVANPDETWSLAQFQQEARKVIADIHARGKLPILVGGTGQYVRAVTEGWSPPEVKANSKMRDEIGKLVLSKVEGMNEERGKEWLHDRLKSLDPEAAEKIDARNVRRTIRALEVILTTGRKFSAQCGRVDSPYRLITIGLMRPREELYARVDARIESMFAAGLVDEVRGLLEKGYSPELPSMSGIGYGECAGVAKGQLSAEQAKVQMRHDTRVFVRRQANWFKEGDSSIRWFVVQKNSMDEIENFLRKVIDF
jgi:tRNA dimethylallyltransferase